MLLTNVAYVSDLRYHSCSLTTLIKNGHTFEGRLTGVVARLKSERSIIFPLSGPLFSLCGYRVGSSSREKACAVLAPGQAPNKSAINIMTSTALLDTRTRFYSARPRGNKISSQRGAAGVQGVLHGEGSSLRYQPVYAHTRR